MIVPYEAYKYCIHAEQDCISKCRNKNILKYCSLILVKLTGQGNTKQCEPCNKCLHIINKYKIKKIINYFI